jgi:hypothetical protein
LLTPLYPNEIAYAQANPLAGYFSEHYGHPSLRYLVNHLVANIFATVWRESIRRNPGQPALVADCGSKYHQLRHLLTPSEYALHAYRPEINAYDKAYNKQHSSILPPKWVLSKDTWNCNLDLPPGADLTVVDAIYYPGVRDAVTRHLHKYPTAVAHVVFSAYSQVPGHYSFIDNEGSYCVYDRKLPGTSLFSPKTELWVRNMPTQNEAYEHKLFDYTPYATRSTLDVNGIFWKEVTSFHIGAECRLVYARLTSSHPVAQVQLGPEIGHDKDDDMLNRYGYNAELYGYATAYFEFKKLKAIMPEDRASAVCYVHSKMQIFSVSNFQRNMTLRNVRYAAFDYVESLKKESEAIAATTQPASKMTPLEYIKQQWVGLKVAPVLQELPIEFYLIFILVVWIRFSAFIPYEFIILWLLQAYIDLFMSETNAKALYMIASISGPILRPYLILFYYAFVVSSTMRYCFFAYNLSRAYRKIPVQHQALSRYITYYDIVRGTVDLRDLSKKQAADLQTPFNRSLKITSTLKQVIEFARAVVTTVTIPTFVSSGFEFTCEFVRTTPSVMKKTVQNTLYALFVRQCGHYQRPKKFVMKNFIRFAQGYMDDYIIPAIITSPFDYSMEEHLRSYDARKRETYTRYWTEYSDTFGVKHVSECMQKSNELAFGDACKPRFLFNPHGSVKVIGTYINAYYLKKLREMSWLAVGLNTGALTDRIQQVRRHIRCPIPITWDGSNHDGHQYKELIEGVDGYLFNRTFRHVLPHLPDLIPGKYPEYLRILTCSSSRFYISYKRAGHYVRVVQGTIDGTTFSGHPTRTTLGNSLRVFLYAKYVEYLASTKVGILVAGDDVICFVSKRDLPAFQRSFWQIYIDGSDMDSKDMITHGLGQVAKDYRESRDNTLDFLSKYGMIYHEEVIMNRRIERALLSGNHTRKINQVFTVAHFNWSITTGLKAWARTWPVVSEYITARLATIPHWVPSSWHKLGKRLQFSISELFGYQFNAHINHYDYRPMAEAFYIMYNPRALALMQDDVAFAPHYFDQLYDRAPMKNISIHSYAEAEKKTAKQTKDVYSTPSNQRPKSKAVTAA